MTEENQEEGEKDKAEDFPKAGKDNELEAQKQSELDAERDEHNRRTAGQSGDEGERG